MEGDKFSGKTNALKTLSRDELELFTSVCLNQLFYWDCVASLYESISPQWYFPLSHSVLFADCMFSLGFGTGAGSSAAFM